MKAITYVTTVVTRLEMTGDDVLLVTLADPDRWELPAFEAGAHLVLILGNGMRRAYSLCSDPDDRYHYQIAVKRETSSRGGSVWIHHHLGMGDWVGVSLPRSTMKLHQDKKKHLLIAGGIGITPMLAFIYQLERKCLDYELHYFYRGNPPLFREVQQAMNHGRLFLYPSSENAGVKTSVEAIMPALSEDICLYCCGPERMMVAYNQAGAAWPTAQLQQEHFSGVTIDDASLPPFTLELRRSGKMVAVAGGQTPLQALLEAGVDIDHSCEGGICGACSVNWCEGKPVHRDKVLSAEERKSRLILCVAGCDSEKLVLDL
ncbi:PDR/VanB family oxidoreductase [Pantoea cypripedii]|uniref:PDR/VanB family oxidoreductase n=1 Tax=Pantoea cypripedii TaxID=55209 RepID=UPI002FC937DB